MNSTMSESPHKEAYAQLAELELEFDQAETELLKHQIRLFTPLYTRRSAVLSTIPTFWPMIFENFGPEIDEHISAEDWAFLGENLISLDIHRPDPEMAPRNFDIVFGFKEGNGVIKGTELRKRFVYKSLRDGDERWTGLVSEPVTVEWVNEEKDLTVGINALAAKIFEIRKARTQKKIEEKKKPGYKPPKPVKPEELEADEDGLAEFELELEEKLNQYQSFFNWFSWCGEYFMVMEKEAEKTEKSKEREEKAEEEEEEAPEFDGIDVFPNGEKIAYLFAEDMYPNALKHFGELPAWNLPIPSIPSPV
ncbi:hypothetical protein BDZ91DRAFT_415230 [Kalaharituber pfeilii]|nr:hypothetical protein BDZ91DRAFT_415230 [Kalaharituber pfeilii]